MLEQVTKLLEAADIEVVKLIDLINTQHNCLISEIAYRDQKYYEGQVSAYNKVLDLLVDESASKSFKEKHIDFIKSEDC